MTFGGTFGGALSWRHQAAGHGAFFLLFTIAGWRLWRTKAPLDVRILAPAQNLILALILTDMGLRAAVQQSWNSREAFVSSLAAWILFYLLLNWFSNGNGLATMCVVAAVVCVLAGLLLARVQGYRELALPLGNRALMAGLLTLAAPLAIGVARECSGAPGGMLISVLAAFTIIVGAVETRSAAAVAILPFSVFSSIIVGRKRIAYLVIPVGLGLAIVCAGTWLSNFEPFARIRSVATSGVDSTASWNNRVRFWTGSIRAIEEKPLVGWGAGQAGISYPPYRVQQPGLAQSGEVVADLHSVPLQWAFEFGALGAMLRLVGVGIFLFARHSEKTAQQRTAVVALAAFGVFSLLNCNLGNPATALIALMAAVVAAPRVRSLKLTVPASNKIGLLLVCGAAAMAAFEARLDYANYLLAKSSRQQNREAAASLIRASLLDSRGGFYDAVAAIRMKELLKSAPPDESFIFQAARNHYGRALSQNRWSTQLLGAYGNLVVGHAGSCEEIPSLEKAVSLDFYFSLSHFDLANAYRSCGSTDQAVREAGIAILTTPMTVFSSEWRRNPQFLADALDTASQWLDGCTPDSAHPSGEQVRRLRAFLRATRTAPVGGQSQAALTLSEPVAGQLSSDPFAYIFQRQMPVFEPIQIRLDGVDSGTWTPEGIGKIKDLRAVSYAEIAGAYKQRKLDDLLRSVLVCRTR